MENLIGYESLPSENSKGGFSSSIIGYLDILGFKNKVKNKLTREIVVQNYCQIYDLIYNSTEIEVPAIPIGKIGGFGGNVGKPYYEFIKISQRHIYSISDSIFLIILPDKKGELHWINYVIATFIIMLKIQSICINNGLATRGSISSGELFYDSEKGIFIGEPITQAYLWEKTQNFSWLSIDPFCSITKKYNTFHYTKGAHLLKRIKPNNTLFKENEIKEYYKYLNINYEDIKNTEVLIPIFDDSKKNDIITKLKKMRKENKNHAKYYDNAISIIS